MRIAGLERVPAVLDGLVSAAGEALRLGSLTLGSADTAGARARAETAALADAHQRAQRLAEAAEALAVVGNDLLAAAAGLTAEQFDARLERLVAQSRALWGRSGWTEPEQQSSELGLRTSLALLAGVVRDDPHRP